MVWELIQQVGDGADLGYTRVKWWSPLTKNPDVGLCVKPGESVEGHIVDYNPNEGAADYNGDTCGYVDLKVTEGDYQDDIARIILDKSPLRNGFRGVPDPKPGQKVRVKFLGRVPSKKPGGQDYNDYEVFCDSEEYNPAVVATHNLETV